MVKEWDGNGNEVMGMGETVSDNIISAQMCVRAWRDV